MSTNLHQPVMLSEAISGLQIKPDSWYLDATFGRGGHTAAMLEQKAKVVAFDIDQTAIEFGQKQFQKEIEANRLVLVKANFADLSVTLNQLKQTHPVQPIEGILFDFGTSLDQLKSPQRGFSFEHPDSQLDMRMDQSLGVTAADLLTVLSRQQLETLFREYGGEKHSRKIAQAIDRYRGPNRENNISQVGQLVEIIQRATPNYKSHLHPATKVFQALRIAVNSELDNIKASLNQTLDILTPPARIVTISFHQGEDRIVKQQFKSWSHKNLGEIITPKPLTPSQTETNQNPAARSAKLRIFTYQPAK